MLWFDPSLQMYAAWDDTSWESQPLSYERTWINSFDSPRSKRSWEYAAQSDHSYSMERKYSKFETPPNDHYYQRRRCSEHRPRVRFVPDDEEDDERHHLDRPPVVDTLVIPNRASLTLEEKNAMWYNGHDIRRFFRNSRIAQDHVRAQTKCQCLQIRKCPTCRQLWRAMD